MPRLSSTKLVRTLVPAIVGAAVAACSPASLLELSSSATLASSAGLVHDGGIVFAKSQYPAPRLENPNLVPIFVGKTGEVIADATARELMVLTNGQKSGYLPEAGQATIGVQNAGAQYGIDGDTVSVPISLSKLSGHTVTYTASGLPSGLTIDTDTGTIAGTIANNADVGSPYSVTVTATDTNTSVSADETFTWDIRQPGGFVTVPDLSRPQPATPAEIQALRDQIAQLERNVEATVRALIQYSVEIITTTATLVGDVADYVAAPNAAARAAAANFISLDLQTLANRISDYNEANYFLWRNSAQLDLYRRLLFRALFPLFR